MTVLCTATMSACGLAFYEEAEPTGNAVYYWRTTFDLDSSETAFLKHHKVSRIYLRMFDVAVERNAGNETGEIVPIATTRFCSEIPKSLEIVPTAFITLDALQAMRGNEAKYAELIVERMRAMASYNGCGEILEMQLDCDWTSSTRDIYFALCRSAKKLLHSDSIALSSTIRLHQLSEPAPPVDCGVLMLYNTGALKNHNTRNSILDIADVRPYLLKHECNIPLDYAYPAFGWGVKFHDGKFQCIVSRPESEVLSSGETIRLERPAIEDVLDVKALVDRKLGAPYRFRIIYHLDNEQLKNYTADEIAEIYAGH